MGSEKLEKKDGGKKNKATSIMIIATILAAIIIVLLTLLLSGKTTTTGNYPDNENNKSLTCVSNDINYPIFTYDNSTKKEAKINILFSKDSIRSIALTYSLYYGDATSIIASEAHNHAAMNISFGANNLGTDALNAKYAKLENRMQMNLYATNSEINNVALRYFLINIDNDPTPDTVSSYKAIYEDEGMNCEESE